MIPGIKKGTFGKYLQDFFAISDLLLVNLVFGLALLLCPDLHLPRIRTLWVVVNTGYLPVMMWRLTHRRQHKAMLMDKVAKDALQVVIAHALIFFSLITFLRINVPARLYLTFYALMMVLIPLWWIGSRYFVKTLRKRGYNFTRVAIVGTGVSARRLLDEINSDAGFGYKVVGVFSDDPEPDFPAPVIGTIADLRQKAAELRIEQVFFTLSGTQEEALATVMKIADDNMMQFYYMPQISRRVARSFELNSIGVVPLLSVRRNPLKSVVNRALKRSFDVGFSLLVLAFSPVVLIPVAIAIKLSSPGPIFFKQERTGYKGHTFKCWKFRTMRVNSASDSRQATSDDPRTTRVGRFLRHSSIDELPQFVNVLLGDMSVVGPRPHMLKHTEEYTRLIDQYMVRHEVKPGITGWAQVNGYRGLTDELWKMERRVEYDVWYIENWTFLLDFKIIVRTVMNAAAGEKNAF